MFPTQLYMTHCFNRPLQTHNGKQENAALLLWKISSVSRSNLYETSHYYTSFSRAVLVVFFSVIL